MLGTLFRSVCGILCGQQKSAKPYSFKKLPKSKENTRNPKISGVVLELLTRFELVTSSLPKIYGKDFLFSVVLSCCNFSFVFNAFTLFRTISAVSCHSPLTEVIFM